MSFCNPGGYRWLCRGNVLPIGHGQSCGTPISVMEIAGPATDTKRAVGLVRNVYNKIRTNIPKRRTCHDRQEKSASGCRPGCLGPFVVFGPGGGEDRHRNRRASLSSISVLLRVRLSLSICLSIPGLLSLPLSSVCGSCTSIRGTTPRVLCTGTGISSTGTGACCTGPIDSAGLLSAFNSTNRRSTATDASRPASAARSVHGHRIVGERVSLQMRQTTFKDCLLG